MSHTYYIHFRAGHAPFIPRHRVTSGPKVLPDYTVSTKNSEKFPKIFYVVDSNSDIWKNYRIVYMFETARFRKFAYYKFESATSEFIGEFF